MISLPRNNEWPPGDGHKSRRFYTESAHCFTGSEAVRANLSQILRTLCKHEKLVGIQSDKGNARGAGKDKESASSFIALYHGWETQESTQNEEKGSSLEQSILCRQISGGKCVYRVR